MIQLTAEIKAKMRKLALVHFVLALISSAALMYFYLSARPQGEFAFRAILFLNLLAIGLLAFYSKREKFP